MIPVLDIVSSRLIPCVGGTRFINSVTVGETTTDFMITEPNEPEAEKPECKHDGDFTVNASIGPSRFGTEIKGCAIVINCVKCKENFYFCGQRPGMIFYIAPLGVVPPQPPEASTETSNQG